MIDVIKFLLFLIMVIIILLLTTILWIPFKLFGSNSWIVLDNTLNKLFE